MGSLNKLEVLDVIRRMNEGGLARSNIVRSPRQIDIVARLQVEKPGEWKSEGSLKVIVHRKIHELLGEGLIREEKRRHTLTDKGRKYYLSNKSLLRSNFRHEWDEINTVPGLHASYGVNKGFLLVQERREQEVRDKISDFIDELKNIAPEETLDMKLYINLDRKKDKTN